MAMQRTGSRGDHLSNVCPATDCVAVSVQGPCYPGPSILRCPMNFGKMCDIFFLVLRIEPRAFTWSWVPS